MEPLTAAEMRDLDRKATEIYGIPSLILMENAGRGIADLIHTLREGKRVTVLAGKGNNGGDGLVVARHLHNRGYRVRILLAADPEQLKGDARVNHKIVSAMGLPLDAVTEKTPEKEMIVSFANSDIIVDALFGIGLNAPLEGWRRGLVETLNRSGKTVVAVDVPSGLHADTGDILGACVRAKVTATLGAPKKGLFEHRGPEMAGRVAVIDISLPNPRPRGR